VQTEEGDADRHEEGAGRRRGGEDIGVVLDDALESAEGVQVRPVLLGKGRGGEGDDLAPARAVEGATTTTTSVRRYY